MFALQDDGREIGLIMLFAFSENHRGTEVMVQIAFNRKQEDNENQKVVASTDCFCRCFEGDIKQCPAGGYRQGTHNKQ